MRIMLGGGGDSYQRTKKYSKELTEILGPI